MAICPGGVDTKMIDDIVDNNGHNLSNKNLMKTWTSCKEDLWYDI